MFPIILLYAAGGALLTGGVFGGKAVLDLANDVSTKERVRRRMADERDLLTEAMATEEVREEARRQGVDLIALQKDIHESREGQETLLRVLRAVLDRSGTTPESVRRLLED